MGMQHVKHLKGWQAFVLAGAICSLYVWTISPLHHTPLYTRQSAIYWKSLTVDNWVLPLATMCGSLDWWIWLSWKRRHEQHNFGAKKTKQKKHFPATPWPTISIYLLCSNFFLRAVVDGGGEGCTAGHLKLVGGPDLARGPYFGHPCSVPFKKIPMTKCFSD